MDFAFSTAPERISASMCRPMAWAALDQGHRVHPLRAFLRDGLWRVEMEEPGAELPIDPFIYGHTGLVSAVMQGAVPGWRVDYAPENYDREEWIKRLGAAMWNSKAEIMPLSQALSSWTQGRMHLCPSGADSGPKAFKGICVDRSEIGFELGRAARGRELDPSMRVELSRPDMPAAEYRCVFIGGEHAASGRYLLDGKLAETSDAPDRVIGFAKETAFQWLPGQHCVVDVGVGVDGRLGIVEHNSIHSSGLYQIQRAAVVSAIANAWGHEPKPRAASKP